MNKEDKPAKLVRLSEACEILKVHPNTLRQWDRKRVLKSIRLGVKKDRKYKLEDLQKFIDSSDKKNKL